MAHYFRHAATLTIYIFCKNFCDYYYSYVDKKNSDQTKTKVQLGKPEDLIGSVKQFMNLTASHLVTRRSFQEVVQNGRFCNNKGGTRELLAREKKLFLGQDIFCFEEKGMVRVFSCRLTLLMRDRKGPFDGLPHWY